MNLVEIFQVYSGKSIRLCNKDKVSELTDFQNIANRILKLTETMES